MLEEQYTRDTSRLSIDPFSSACSGIASPCFSISITGSEFTNFGKMKPALTEPFWVNPDNGMLYSGTILDLEGFKGPVSLEGNTFTGNVLKYSDCSIGRKMRDNIGPSTADAYPSYGTKSKVQIQSLISVVNHDYDFDMHANTFTNNAGTKGIVYLDMNHRQGTHVYLTQNTFSNNVGYLDSSVIHPRARGPTGLDVSNVEPSSSQLFCTGYHLDGNTFEYNFGCSGSVGGVLKFECLNKGQTSTDSGDRFSFSTLTSPIAEKYLGVDVT